MTSREWQVACWQTNTCNRAELQNVLQEAVTCCFQQYRCWMSR